MSRESNRSWCRNDVGVNINKYFSFLNIVLISIGHPYSKIVIVNLIIEIIIYLNFYLLFWKAKSAKKFNEIHRELKDKKKKSTENRDESENQNELESKNYIENFYDDEPDLD